MWDAPALPLLPRWLTESARWMVMVGKSQQALKELQKVARINGKKEEGEKLDIEVRGSDQGISGVFCRVAGGCPLWFPPLLLHLAPPQATSVPHPHPSGPLSPPQALKSYMQKEMTSSRSHHTVFDLVRTPVVRRISCCLCFVW